MQGATPVPRPSNFRTTLRPRLAHVLDSGQHPQALIENLVDAPPITEQGRQFLQIHADREALVTRGGEHDGTHIAVGSDLVDQRFELVHEGKGHSVVRRVVDRHDSHRRPALVGEAGVGQCWHQSRVTHSCRAGPDISGQIVDSVGQRRAIRVAQSSAVRGGPFAKPAVAGPNERHVLEG